MVTGILSQQHLSPVDHLLHHHILSIPVSPWQGLLLAPKHQVALLQMCLFQGLKPRNTQLATCYENKMRVAHLRICQCNSSGSSLLYAPANYLFCYFFFNFVILSCPGLLLSLVFSTSTHANTASPTAVSTGR